MDILYFVGAIVVFGLFIYAMIRTSTNTSGLDNEYLDSVTQAIKRSKDANNQS